MLSTPLGPGDTGVNYTRMASVLRSLQMTIYKDSLKKLIKIFKRFLKVGSLLMPVEVVRRLGSKAWMHLGGVFA